MGSGIVTVGRRPYASGLYWENSPSGRISQAAKEAARQPGHQADFYAVRVGNKAGRVPQFGLSHAAAEHSAGMPALAACLANQQPGSWVGAFRLREGTAVVVVRDDLIVPDGDQFFLDETEARDRLLQEMALGGFQRVYAPESWGIPGADSMPISLLLNDRVDIRLRPVAMSRRTLTYIGSALFFLLILLGAGWYVQQQNEKEEAERLARLQAFEQAKLQAQQMLPGSLSDQVQYPIPERTWEKHPRPMDVIAACRVALSQVPLAVVGWNVSSVSCDQSALSVAWTRSGGFAAVPPNAVVGDTGLSATLSVPISNLSPRGSEALPDPDETTARYLRQDWPGTIARVPDEPPPPPPPDFTGTWDPPPIPWVKRSFNLVTPALPWTLPLFFGDLPGVVITSLAYASSGASDTWTIDGEIYENRR